jgi:ribosomal-protein-alanine acetyltransferase
MARPLQKVPVELIREMTASDRSAVAWLFVESAGASPWDARQVGELQGSGTRFLVAEDGGQITGAVALREIAGEAEILNLAVKQGWRRRGIGGRLMERVVRAAASAGAVKVFLEVRESNAGARAFYLGLGFTEAGRRRDYYRNPTEDALLLFRTLG